MTRVKDLLAETGAVLEGHFRLSSGLHSPHYVQCARLLELPGHADELGRLLAEKILPWKPDRIVAPALGGVVIGYTVAAALGIPMVFTERKDGAMTLRRGFGIRPGERVVIVEDVVTTGKSTLETASAVESLGGAVVGFASILNRSGSGNRFERPYVFLETMRLQTWDPADCPLCEGESPLDSPGSRFGGTS